jgi:HAD superfamily hydrolase (TIGR01509 family)
MSLACDVSAVWSTPIWEVVWATTHVLFRADVSMIDIAQPIQILCTVDHVYKIASIVMMNDTMKFEAVIFDMDGLMFDTERVSQIAWRRAAQDWGHDFHDDIYKYVIGRNVADIEKYLYQIFGPDFPIDQAYQRKREYVNEYIVEYGFPVKPGLGELLDLIEERSLKVAVASSSPREIVIRNLKFGGIPLDRFDAIMGGDDVVNGKPAPDIFLATSEQLGVVPERCLVLEDSNTGIKAAHSAGMVPVMVPDMKPPTEETILLAYKILPDLFSVMDFISAY